MSNIVKLLERSVNRFSLKKEDEVDVSTFILNCENVEQLIFQVQKLKSLSKDIITDFSMNDEEKQIFDKKTDLTPIKIIPPINKKIDIEILNKVMKHAVNDRIIVTSGKFFITQYQYKALLSETRKCTAVTFLDETGNILSEIFYFNRWMEKWLIRILVENKQNPIENLFRISSNSCFLKISKFDIITEFKKISLSERKKESYVIFKKIVKKVDLPQNELIKLVALFQGIRDYQVNPAKVLKFKIQQLLNLISVFLRQRRWFLVFQISLKLLEITNKSKEKSILPETWSVGRIKKTARKSLINEAQEYAVNKIERLRYFSLKDIILNDLAAQEKDWIQNELSLIIETINEDKNIHYPLNE